MYAENLSEHFLEEGKNSLMENVSITLIDKTDLLNPF